MKILAVFVIVFLFSCNKSEDRACWKSLGEDQEMIVSLENFNQLVIHPYYRLILVQDSVNFAVIKGGKNVIDWIDFSILEEELTIKNNNKCRFLRNPRKTIEVELHFVDLKFINFGGSLTLKSQGKISVPDLTLRMIESSGTAELNLEVDNLTVNIESSFADFKLSGTAKHFKCTLKGNGYGDSGGLLVSDQITIISRSSGDLRINGNVAHLLVETNDRGNVFYFGAPGSISWNDYGEGKLLKEP